MEELIQTFHIDWMLMVSQVVNFGLVFLALYFIAAKPLSKLVKDRTEEITTGLENAEKAELAVKNANLKKDEIVRDAKNQAKVVLANSQADGKEIVKEAREKAGLEKEEILKQAKLDAEKEKKGGEEALRKEASILVEAGIKKVIEGYVATGKGDDIIKNMLVRK